MTFIFQFGSDPDPGPSPGQEVHFSMGKQKSVKHKIWPTFKQLINSKSTHERAKPDEGFPPWGRGASKRSNGLCLEKRQIMLNVAFVCLFFYFYIFLLRSSPARTSPGLKRNANGRSNNNSIKRQPNKIKSDRMR